MEITLPDRPSLFEDFPETAILVAQVKNVHSEKIVIGSVTSEPACFSATDLGRIGPLAPGDAGELKLIYSRTGLRPIKGFPLDAKITITSVVGNRSHEDTFLKTIYKVPAVHAEVGPIIVSGHEDGDDVYADLKLKPNESVKSFYAGLGVPLGQTWLSPLDPFQDVARGTITLAIKPSELEAGVDVHGTVAIRVHDHPDIPIQVTVVRAPLQFTQPMAFTVLTGQLTWLSLPYNKVSKRKITIDAAKICGVKLDGAVIEIGNGSVALEHDSLPLDLPEIPDSSPEKFVRRSDDFRIKIDGRILRAGNYEIEMQLRLAGMTESGLAQTFSVMVNEPEPTNDVLAIDFGTCNSCAAYFGIAQPVVEFNQPSAVVIRGSGETLIGTRAKDLTGEYVSNVKLEFGKDVPLVGDLTPREVAFMAIREILWRAEASANKRFRTLVLAHPSRFTNNQINDYRYALDRLNREKIIDSCYMIDEASAASFSIVAGLDEIEDLQEISQRDEFGLFVFDFGGGTIDMTFSLVSNLGHGRRAIVLCNTGGMRQLGGQDLNRTILQIMADKFRDRLIEESHGALRRSQIWIPLCREDLEHNPHKLDRLDLQKCEREIGWRLDEVEETKMQMLKDEQDARRASHLLQVYLDQRNRLARNVDLEVSYEEFGKRVRSRLKEAIATANHMVVEAQEMDGDLPRPDLIVLAGGSSRIPWVAEMMKATFPFAKVMLAPKLKECVALGACTYGAQQMDPEGGGVEIFDFGSRARSSFGYSTLKGGHTVFRPVVRKGDELPQTVGLSHLGGGIAAGLRFTLIENFGFGTKLAEIAGDIEIIDDFRIMPADLEGIDPITLAGANVILTVKCDESIFLELKLGERRLQLRAAREVMTYESPCR